MTWNHRIIRKVTGKETSYQIHEVFYNKHGKIKGWTKEPVLPFGESKSELREDILHFWSAFRLPVLDELIDADGKETLREDTESEEPNPGHYFEVMDRASVAMLHFNDFVGTHPVIQTDKQLQKRVVKISDNMYRLYQELALKAMPDIKKW